MSTDSLPIKLRRSALLTVFGGLAVYALTCAGARSAAAAPGFAFKPTGDWSTRGNPITAVHRHSPEPNFSIQNLAADRPQALAEFTAPWHTYLATTPQPADAPADESGTRQVENLLLLPAEARADSPVFNTAAPRLNRLHWFDPEKAATNADWLMLYPNWSYSPNWIWPSNIEPVSYSISQNDPPPAGQAPPQLWINKDTQQEPDVDQVAGQTDAQLDRQIAWETTVPINEIQPVYQVQPMPQQCFNQQIIETPNESQPVTPPTADDDCPDDTQQTAEAVQVETLKQQQQKAQLSDADEF